MQFKHPEILYALLLLLIPVIIHLFQLRRFQKVDFTNVKFLKNVELQTRKSSQIKKWLTLLTRLGIMACIVLAFAQPYISDSENFNTKNEMVIYIDNSHSMQAKGVNGSLLNEAIQDLIGNLNEDETVTIFTNDKVFRDVSVKAISNELIQLPYSNDQLSYESVYLKGKQFFSKDANAIRNLILLSDFQQRKSGLDFNKDTSIALKLVQAKPVVQSNISIDSTYINTVNNNKELNVVLSTNSSTPQDVSIALYNNDQLLAKTAVAVKRDDKATAMFTLPENNVFNGKLMVEDASLQYDNTLYFNLNTQSKIKVLGINDKASDNFLKKLYTDDEFAYTSSAIDALNYSLIADQNLIVLNELDEIPSTLSTALKAFRNDGGNILIIPSINVTIESYNQFFTSNNINQYNAYIDAEKRVTNINYDHPILSDAFYKRVTNFQYPKVNTYYTFSTNNNTILSFEDGASFLVGLDDVFVFSGAINNDNSNFKNSPLIVPVLYNIAKQSIKLPRLYYTIGSPNTIEIKTILDQDDILSLDDGTHMVIPQQRTYSNKVSIMTDEYPDTPGIINVISKSETLQKLSFNTNRNESQLTYLDMNGLNNVTVDNKLSSAIATVKSNTNVNELWKWFVIFALAFLITEMLILKYLK